MNVLAPPDQQTKLVDAAAAAGVPWIIPNEFGGDGTNEQGGKDVFLGPPKKAVRDHIEELGASAWLGIACGFWYEYSLGGGPYRYGFDLKNKTVKMFDEGATPIDTSTWPQTGRQVANLLALKALPEDEHDTSPCLAQYRNRFVFAASFTVTQQEMFASVLRVTGGRKEDWTVTHVPVKEVYQEGVKMLQSGNRKGFVQLLYSRLFFPDGYGNHGSLVGLDNEKLGLPKEDLDEFTKEAIRLAESGYFDGELA